MGNVEAAEAIALALLLHSPTLGQCHQAVLSGNSPGIQREARAAGKARCRGTRGPAEVSTPRSISAEMTRRAWRGLAPSRAAASPRGSSPRNSTASKIAPAFGGKLPMRASSSAHARAQAVRFDQAFNEGDLVDAGRKKEARELGQGLLAQAASAVEIVAAGQVARGEAALVCRNVSGRPLAIDQTPPVSSVSSSIACDIRRATRPLPSKNK
jgi:hypothetical protein